MKQDFRKLRSEMQACKLCSTLPLGPNPVFRLEADAKILIVGQAPGRLAHLKNRPFDDPSGNRLRDWLAIDWATFYTNPKIGIFPMALCFPGAGPAGDAPPPKICAETWRDRVMQSLRNVELTLILGAYAIEWHLPHLKRLPVKEAVKRSSGGEDGYFVLPHPSPRNNRWLRQNAWFEADVIPTIQKAVRHRLDEPARG